MNTENNKLFIEFIGIEKESDGTPYINLGADSFYFDLYDEDSCKFHTSWDWLMPVVEKIESLKCVDELNIKYDAVSKTICVEILPSFTESFNSIIIYTNTVIHNEPKLLCVYNAVIEFIKWYNQQTENGTK